MYIFAAKCLVLAGFQGSNYDVIIGCLILDSCNLLGNGDRLRQRSWSPCSVLCVAAPKIVRCQSWDSSAI